MSSPAPIKRISTTDITARKGGEPIVSLTAPPQLNVNSLGELFAMARATPGKLNWASVTGATDVVISAFLKREGLDMAKIPYRDPVQALNDVAENRPTQQREIADEVEDLVTDELVFEPQRVVEHAGFAEHGVGDHAAADVADGETVRSSRVEDVIRRLATPATVHVFVHDGGIARNVLM